MCIRDRHYGEWYDCKTCDEKGVVGNGKFENVKDPNTAIKIGLATFVSRFINTLINVIDYTLSLIHISEPTRPY